MPLKVFKQSWVALCKPPGPEVTQNEMDGI